MSLRIHTIGASGSGTTTLAKHLANTLGFPHFDSDDYYWEKTNPPFTTKRPVEERLRLLQDDLAQRSNWLLSGSLVSWGDPIISQFTHVIFVYIPPEIRLERLKARERQRYGSRIDPDGDMEKIHTDLMEWAAKYDTGGMEVRSRVMHEKWLERLNCPVIRLENPMTTEQQTKIVLSYLQK